MLHMPHLELLGKSADTSSDTWTRRVYSLGVQAESLIHHIRSVFTGESRDTYVTWSNATTKTRLLSHGNFPPECDW